jgi:hypothetical protein
VNGRLQVTTVVTADHVLAAVEEIMDELLACAATRELAGDVTPEDLEPLPEEELGVSSHG